MYCIDTSSLIHAWRRDYPPDIFGGVWERLNHLAENGELIAPEEVLLELARGGDELHNWAQQRKGMFLSPVSEVQALVQQYINSYPSFLPHSSVDGVWADPYVVALAQHRGLSVVTGEVLVPENSKRLRIPNICVAAGVRYMTLLDLLRDSGFKV